MNLIFNGKNSEKIELIDINRSNAHVLNASKQSELSLLWFKSPNNVITVDNIDYQVEANQLVSFTEFHHIEAKDVESAVLMRWNRSFYCVVNHDSEVSCKGILYYGATTVPIIKPLPNDVHTLETVYEMLRIEMQSKDDLQLEMLQMMLKRALIICTRIYKSQQTYASAAPSTVDIIREYNFLVEQHFRSKHTVKEYADLLYKSPKTLSNLFRKHGDTTPLKFIHNRIMLEARRQLTYTDQSISDISYDLGFGDVQTFSRFFKKQEGLSPQSFREREVLPTQ